MRTKLRLATIEDAAAMLAIYTPYVEKTAISFELEPPPLEEFADRVARTLEYYPWLVCEVDGTLVGFAYACAFRSRPAYQWATELTVYVREEERGQGFGRALYQGLLGCLRQQGFCTALAVITLPNPASVAMHESLGFVRVGVLEGVGFKLGTRHDVGWWQLELATPRGDPASVRPVHEVAETAAWTAALDVFAD